MKIGVTASRHGSTKRQREETRALLVKLRATELHHGDCVGGDSEVCEIARDLGMRIVSHPPENPTYRAFVDSDESMPEAPYATRNAAIVAAVDILVALPRQQSEVLRSGTWSTVRRAYRDGVEVALILPRNPDERESPMIDESDLMGRLGYDRLEGRRIVSVKLMTAAECEEFGWDFDVADIAVVLVLDDGTKIVAARDQELNGAGFLFVDEGAR